MHGEATGGSKAELEVDGDRYSRLQEWARGWSRWGPKVAETLEFAVELYSCFDSTQSVTSPS
jgi:hypothetical protein